MCKSIAEGGQRCAAHTRPAYEAAVRQLVAGPVDVAALEALERAAADYASTGEGQTRLAEAVAKTESIGRWDEAAVLRAALAKGRLHAEAARETARQIEAEAARKSVAAVKKGGLRDTYAERVIALERAQAAFTTAKAAAVAATEAAGGRAVAAGRCAECRHTDHQAVACTAPASRAAHAPACGCASSTKPTRAQIKAAGLHQTAYAARDAVTAAQEAVDTPTPGDKFVVSRGRKVPRGTHGTLVRVWDGAWGRRALLRTATGDVWVGVENLDRDLPAVEADADYVSHAEQVEAEITLAGAGPARRR